MRQTSSSETPLAAAPGGAIAFDALPEPQWALVGKGAAPLFNRCWRERIDAHASDWLDAVHGADRARVERLWAHAHASGLPLRMQARLRVADGSVRWHQISIAPAGIDSDPGTGDWCGLCVDIDDCMRIGTTARAEQDGIGVFLGELNHELRNRLAALAMSAQVLQHDEASAEMRARAQLAIQRQAFTLTERIDRLLAAVQPADPETIIVERVDIVAVLKEVCASVQDVLAERHAELACEVPASPMEIEIDAAGLREALSSLVLHALDGSAAHSLVVAAQVGRNADEVGLRVTRRAHAPPGAVPALRGAWERSLSLHIASRFAEANGGCVIVRDDGLATDATFDLFVARSAKRDE